MSRAFNLTTKKSQAGTAIKQLNNRWPRYNYALSRVTARGPTPLKVRGVPAGDSDAELNRSSALSRFFSEFSFREVSR